LPAPRTNPALKSAHWLAGILLFSIFHTPAICALHNPHGDKGVFLVATEQLHGTSFQEAVILLTHYSARGVTGLTINRPTDIPLSEALPNIHQFNQHTEPLYLGGPVSTNAIFVLVRTKQPRKSMHHIINDIYFSTGNNAFGGPLAGTVRTYAGYAGWTAHQLQNEISRGDWLVIQTEPAIVFEQDPSRLWNRLMKTWSGDWI